MKCKNSCCKFWNPDKKCSKKRIEIDEDGFCACYEKGIYYYIKLVWSALSHGNMIPMNLLTEDLKIGLYYVMTIWKLHFVDYSRGSWRWVMLKASEDGPGLCYDDIVKMDWDFEEFKTQMENLNKGILPGANQEKKPPKKASQPFGWLSPSGDFTEAGFADHEEVAQKLIRMRCFQTEYKEQNASEFVTGRDFLVDVKGYVLIHNPCGDGGYNVSHTKPLTKKQNEFLFGYFMDLGDSLRAKRYMGD